MIIRFLSVCILGVLLSTAPGLAVNPDEILDNPKLEQRARDISANLRCLVCQNQSIDDSDAELARDLRVIVRERLVSGDTDAQVMDYVVDRYGEFVLLRPAFSPRNFLLWGTPLLVLFLGALAAFSYSRRYSSGTASPTPLTEKEEQRLNDLLDRKRDQ
ncbi:cytochrome c-type biogenesis protein [Ahrensia marina]|uniref:Cytochrome c-type biogenesis protein n=1 Tax=Ahrensia marina TaxID=1514904 RepID=A0A0M9GPE7_9HYPH|nr:cytochrome c-type biogenesis protein [Ahrensia marina]KPB02289.1 cytochrome C [Ahrensia marina]